MARAHPAAESIHGIVSMALSLDVINCRSPYRLTQIDDMSFSFVTDFGVRYDIGFAQADVFMKEGVYHFFIDNIDHKHAPTDPKILRVVTVLIEEFFRDRLNSMLYICDASDSRQATRDRLYRQWFESYPLNHMMAIYRETFVFHDVTYYTGLLMRNDHPMRDEIANYFHEFIAIMPQQLQMLRPNK